MPKNPKIKPKPLPMSERLAYSLADAEAVTGIKRRTLHDAVSRGSLKAVKRCSRWMIRRDDLLRWLSDD